MVRCLFFFLERVIFELDTVEKQNATIPEADDSMRGGSSLSFFNYFWYFLYFKLTDGLSLSFELLR